MRRGFTTALAVLALAAGGLLLVILAGFFPALEPASPAIEKAHVEPNAPEPSTAPLTPEVALEPLIAESFALCDAPARGARIEPATLPGVELAFFAWCKDGYQLFALDGQPDGTSLVTRLARFESRVELAAGAFAADVTGDGVSDLVLAVSPAAGVIHAPFSGAYLVRGRQAGGYEGARALVEMPVSGLAVVRATGGASDFVVLTRGDVAAQRPGELLWFTGGVAPVKRAQVTAGLDPRDVVVASVDDDERPDVVVAVSQPGRVRWFSWDVEGANLSAHEHPLADATQLLFAGRRLLVRTTLDLFELTSGAAPALAPWAKGVNLGAAVASDLDRDGVLDVLAATAAGLAFLPTPAPADARDLTLPDGQRAADVDAPSDALGRPRPLLTTVPASGEGPLTLVLLPAPPWPNAERLVTNAGSVRDAPRVAQIPLR